MALIRSVATFGGFTMLSRVFGFARDILQAQIVGAGPIADAFVVALKLPSMFRALFAEGAFNAAFVPMFAERLTREGEAGAKRFAEDALAILLIVLIGFTAVCEVAMPALTWALAPGFADEPEKFALAVELTRLTFPYLLFISLVSLLGALLNGLGRFAAPAATPVVFNLTIIAALLWLPPYVPTVGHAAAWGVALSGITQFLFLIHACRRAGMRLRLPRPRLTPEMRRMFVLLGPATLGFSVIQINVFVGQLLASFLESGSISYLYYAERFYQLPIGVIAVAIGTVLLPLMSRRLAAGDQDGALQSQNRAIELGLGLGLPAALAMIAIAPELISVAFQRGAFSAADATATAGALAAYAVGLPAVVASRALIPGFYARQDTATPVRIALIGVGANLILSLALMWPLSFIGLAITSAFVAWLNAAQYAIILHRRGLWSPDRRLITRGLRIVGAAIVMALLLKVAAWMLAPVFAGSTLARIAALGALIVGGLIAYFGLALGFKALDVSDLKAALRRKSST